MFRKSSQVLPGDELSPEDDLDQPVVSGQPGGEPAVEYSSSHEIDIEDEGIHRRPKQAVNMLASVDEEDVGETQYKTQSVDQHEELMRRLSTHRRNSKLMDDSFMTTNEPVSPVNNHAARRNSLRKSSQMIEAEFQDSMNAVNKNSPLLRRNSLRRNSRIGFETEAANETQSQAPMGGGMASDLLANDTSRFIDFERFKAAGAIPRYPECEQSCVDIAQLDRSSSLVVFVSHRWLRADPGAEGW